MQYLLSSSQMKDLDRRCAEEFGLPSRVLMETAGKGCADLIAAQFPQWLQGRTCILCGRGNNGGDGAVIARWLDQGGCEVVILRIGKGDLSPDAKANLELCRALGIPILQISSLEDLPLLEEIVSDSDLVIDAIFGTGFHGEPDDFHLTLFEVVNTSASRVIAVDIPSGLDADTGWCGEAIYADATLCIASLKLGHVLGYGREVCGPISFVPIGIPHFYYHGLPSVKLFTEEDFCPPMRHPDSHKNDFGKVYIFGGVPGYTGASLLAARGALRAGAGYVWMLHRPELQPFYFIRLTEALSLSIPENSRAMPDTKQLASLLGEASAVLIGPGLGRDSYSLRLLEIALRQVKRPLVVDADGLNLIADNPALLKYLAKPNILITPHWGEFSRLAGIPKDSLETDCLSPLREFVARHQARVLLKSHFSVYHDGETTVVNSSGNDGLATGGSGDVLAGIITSFLAQGLSIPEAAINASFLLGRTAEKLAARRGTPSILPSDVADNLFAGDE